MNKKQHINDHVRFMTVLQAVSSVTGIKREHIFGRRRLRRYSDARHMAMFLTRQSTKMTVQRIGKLFDRDHSTVVHASNSVQSLIDISDNYKDDFNQIVNEYDRLIKDLQPDAIEVIVE
mgnify:CR=1 FL=1